ncbi:hypothetical protein [Paenibacillus periandrae]|uniref:hypothetical protein n=1 Tax=Paenibacillus periandrae TaxID=1761741 RepID=UPI001F0892BC|nr:hypothetical protein [Paenibacillus periandrae]
MTVIYKDHNHPLGYNGITGMRACVLPNKAAKEADYRTGEQIAIRWKKRVIPNWKSLNECQSYIREDLGQGLKRR